MTDDFIFTVQHLSSVPVNNRNGFCHAGARAWFKQNGLSWIDFVQQGISANKLLATGDALAIAAVNHARTIIEGK